jgi:general secretion pathway protein G
MAKAVFRSRALWVGFAVGLLGTIALPLAVAFTIDLVNGPNLDGGMRHTKAAADILGIEEALALYAKDHGDVPSSEEGIAALVPEQLFKVPIDPWGQPYIYVREGKNAWAMSYGSDGKPGGQGSAADITPESIRSERSSKDRERWLSISDTAATALFLSSALLLPIIAYRTAKRPPWAVGVLAGAASLIATLALSLGCDTVLHGGMRAWWLFGIGLLFAGGAVGVLLRIRFLDGIVITEIGLLAAGLWMLSGMIVR